MHGGFSVTTVFKVILGKPDSENGGHHEDFAHEYAKVIDMPVANEESTRSAGQGNEIQQHKNQNESDVCDAPGHLGTVGAKEPAPDNDKRE